MRPTFAVDERVFIREVRCTAPKQFGDERRLSGVGGTGNDQCTALDKHSPCMHCSKLLHAMDHGVVQRLHNCKGSIVECADSYDELVIDHDAKTFGRLIDAGEYVRRGWRVIVVG